MYGFACSRTTCRKMSPLYWPPCKIWLVRFIPCGRGAPPPGPWLTPGNDETCPSPCVLYHAKFGRYIWEYTDVHTYTKIILCRGLGTEIRQKKWTTPVSRLSKSHQVIGTDTLRIDRVPWLPVEVHCRTISEINGDFGRSFPNPVYLTPRWET